MWHTVPDGRVLLLRCVVLFILMEAARRANKLDAKEHHARAFRYLRDKTLTLHHCTYQRSTRQIYTLLVYAVDGPQTAYFTIVAPRLN